MSQSETLSGQLIDEESFITMEELCRHCTVASEEIITLVLEGILDPNSTHLDTQSAGQWHFHISSVRRVITTLHLQRDLGVNLSGAALALELLDQIAELQNRRMDQKVP